MPDTPQTIAAHGPYEDLAIAIVALITKVVEGQPPEVRKELWNMYLNDVKAWREFWQAIAR